MEHHHVDVYVQLSKNRLWKLLHFNGEFRLLHHEIRQTPIYETE